MNSKSENFYYNSNLRHRANRLRKEMTKAETCLWKFVLRAKMLKGYQFRRQRPALNFIADFMCKELMLIIEVDGFTHTWEETYEKDLLKEKLLTDAGFKVIRFNDDEVLNAINEVADRLKNIIEEIEKMQAAPF